jgi:hypothetical protein
MAHHQSVYRFDRKCHNKIPPVTLTFNESTPDFVVSPSSSSSPGLLPPAIPPLPGILTNPVHARATSVRSPRPAKSEKNERKSEVG